LSPEFPLPFEFSNYSFVSSPPCKGFLFPLACYISRLAERICLFVLKMEGSRHRTLAWNRVNCVHSCTFTLRQYWEQNSCNFRQTVSRLSWKVCRDYDWHKSHLSAVMAWSHNFKVSTYFSPPLLLHLKNGTQDKLLHGNIINVIRSIFVAWSRKKNSSTVLAVDRITEL
jgi:hypothetical protein